MLLTELLRSPPDPLEGDQPSHPAYRLARKGYLQALLGLEARSKKTFASLEADFEDEELSRLALAGIHLLQGLAARCHADWPTAARNLSEAGRLCTDARRWALASLAKGLEAETFCCMGKIDKAERDIVGRFNDAFPGPRDYLHFSNAVLHFAKGNAELAQNSAREGAESSEHATLYRWTALIGCEAMLVLEEEEAAGEKLEQLLEMADADGAFDESYVYLWYVIARQAVERYLREDDADRSSEVEHLLDTASGYAQNAPRFRGRLLAARASFTATSDPDAGQRQFTQALDLLDRTGARLDYARELMRYARFMWDHSAQGVAERLTAARDQLQRLGASGYVDPFSSELRSIGTQQPESSDATVTVSPHGETLQNSVLADVAGFEVELEAVFEVTRAISSGLRLGPLLDRILHEVVDVLDFERGAVLTLEDDTLECLAGYNLDPAAIEAGNTRISSSIVHRAREKLDVIVTEDASTDDRFRHQQSVLAEQIRDAMCAPLQTSDELHGFLYVDSVDRVGGKELRRDLMQVFANQAAVALENAKAIEEIRALNEEMEQRVRDRTAELEETNEQLRETLEELQNTKLELLEKEKEVLEKEMSVARRIQQAATPEPKLRNRPGVQFLGVTESATQVAGDCWMYFGLPDGRTLFIVADATGHGVGAGMVAASARASLQMFARERRDVDFTEMWKSLDRVLHDSVDHDTMMTAIGCLVDPTAGEVRFGMAGHRRPFYINCSDDLPSMEPLRFPPSSPLGSEGGEFATTGREYSAGDKLFLYSDGVVEAQNEAGDQFGPRRLQKHVLKWADDDVETFHGGFLEDLRSFIGDAEREDDVTVLVIELGEIDWRAS